MSFNLLKLRTFKIARSLESMQFNAMPTQKVLLWKGRLYAI